jgi:hypothetical protein
LPIARLLPLSDVNQVEAGILLKIQPLQAPESQRQSTSTAASVLWHKLATHKSLCVGVSECIKAAVVALTIVAVSGEDEPLFLALALVKDLLLSRLSGLYFDTAYFVAMQRIYNNFTFPVCDSFRAGLLRKTNGLHLCWQQLYVIYCFSASKALQ